MGYGASDGLSLEKLGYASLQEFINAMYRDEKSQIDCMCRYITVNGLIDELQRKDWAGFARGYNGIGYAKNAYDKKLAIAYHKYAQSIHSLTISAHHCMSLTLCSQHSARLYAARPLFFST